MKLIELSTIFSVSYGNKFDLNKMEKDVNGVAFVNRTGINNGIVGLVKEKEEIKPYPAGLLTIALGGSVLSTFLQVKPFYTGQNVAVAEPIEAMSINQLLYYATAIKANKFRYSTCGREANRTFRSLLIPALSEIPSWTDVVNPEMFTGADLAESNTEIKELSTVTWKSFTFEQLFLLKKGKRLTKANMTSGNFPFIGAIDSNNGVSNFVSHSLHLSNTITVNYNGAGVAEAYYQPEPFWASDDVNVLYPKFNLNPYIALFIATIIRQEKYRFSYGRKWHVQRMKSSKIYLPTTISGNPDYDYMEAYIKALPFSSQIL